MNAAFLLSLIATYRRQFALILLCSLAGSSALLAVPWLAGKVLGGLLLPASLTGNLVLVLLVGLIIAVGLLTMASNFLSASASARILADLRRRIHDHVQALPLPFFESERQGDLLALLGNETASLSQFLSRSLARIPSLLLTASGSFLLLLVIDPMLALLAPLLIPGFTVLSKLAARKLHGLAKCSQQAEAALMAHSAETLAVLPAIKSFTRETIRSASFAGLVEDVRSLKVAQARVQALLGPGLSVIAALAAVAFLYGLVLRGEDGARDPAELFSFILYAALLTRPIGSLAQFYGEFRVAQGTLARMQRVLGEQAETIERPALPQKGDQGPLVLSGVWFSYPGREPIFTGFDLEVSPGECIALSGDNGIGKTTLLNLIGGLYLPQQGRLTYGGHELRSEHVQTWRRFVGLVPQHPMLFNGTIRENISFGLDPGEGRIYEAARSAQVLEFVSDLPDGLDTTIGDHGLRLSGGQRQKVAIARALVKDPPILLLDEATSMFDATSEDRFLKEAETFLRGRIVVMVSHRPAVLSLADRIVPIRTLVEGGPSRLAGRLLQS
jgi:ABC-type multidrug transport system fused ATPase/permease subunit